jgi:hypothetical protein
VEFEEIKEMIENITINASKIEEGHLKTIFELKERN